MKFQLQHFSSCFLTCTLSKKCLAFLNLNSPQAVRLTLANQQSQPKPNTASEAAFFFVTIQNQTLLAVWTTENNSNSLWHEPAQRVCNRTNSTRRQGVVWRELWWVRCPRNTCRWHRQTKPAFKIQSSASSCYHRCHIFDTRSKIYFLSVGLKDSCMTVQQLWWKKG